MNSREIIRDDSSPTLDRLKAMSERCDEVKVKLEEAIKFFTDHPEVAKGADLYKKANKMFSELDIPF